MRYRWWATRRVATVKTKMRSILARYNADLKSLFTKQGQEYLNSLELSKSDRFVMDELVDLLKYCEDRVSAANKQLQAFGDKAPVLEREARAVLETIPYVGTVTIDVILSELAQVPHLGQQMVVS